MIKQLTGIRFVAAYLVLAHHFLKIEDAPYLAAFLRSVGDAAVSIFFVLSGFLLTLSNKAVDGTMIKPSADYLIARVARIYPQYLFAFVIMAPFTIMATLAEHGTFAATAPRIVGNGLAYLSLLQSWVPWLANAWNGPAWSLSVEAFFYVAFIWLVPPRARYIWLWMTVAAAAAILPIAVGEMRTWPVPESTWLFFPPFRIGEFLLGMGIAQIYRRNAETPASNAVIEVSLYSGLAVLVVGLALFEGVGARVLTTITVPAVLLALALSKGYLAQLFSSKVMVLLGDSSYGLYLLQGPLFALSVLLIGFEPMQPLQFLAYSGFAVAVSIVIHLWLEIPAAAAIKKWWKRRDMAWRIV